MPDLEASLPIHLRHGNVEAAVAAAVRLGVPALQIGCALTWAQGHALQDAPAPAEAFVRCLLALPEIERDDRRIAERWLGPGAAVADPGARGVPLARLVDTVLGAR